MKKLASLLLSLLLILALAAPALAQSEKQDLLGEFIATDLEGNELDYTLIRDAELTFINVWGTFCDPCIGALPDLSALAEEYAGRVQFIGIIRDGNIGDGPDQATVDLAKQIVEETGANNYTHLVPSTDMLHNSIVGSIQLIPTSFFVDSEGRQVSTGYQGAKTAAAWREVIDTALAELETTPTP